MFFGHPQVVSVFSRKPQNMSLAYGQTQNALQNRREFLAQYGIDYRALVCASQVHGAGVLLVKAEDRGRGALIHADALADTDAMITDLRNLPLCVFTADCLSVFLFNPVRLCIGIVHAGWRSTREKILQKTVLLMQEKLGSRPEDVHAGFGPAIRHCCYEVKEEFRDYFPGGIVKKGDRFNLDLVRINRQQLLETGVRGGNIEDTEICTSCQNKDFFSFRKEGAGCGRMISVIMLK